MLQLLGVLVLGMTAETITVTATETDPIVCKTSKISVVGTRMKPPPVCRRKSEWDLERMTTERELRQINERGSNPGKADGR